MTLASQSPIAIADNVNFEFDLLHDLALGGEDNILPNSSQIIFIDSQVEDDRFLARGILPGIKTVMLDRHRDGIEQITEVLKQKKKIYFDTYCFSWFSWLFIFR